MLEKTMKKGLKSKINAWANSVTDGAVKEAILKDTIITGGAIVSLVNNETPNDYDIYFRTFKALKLVTEYYVNEFNRVRTAVKANVKIFSGKTSACDYIPNDGIQRSHVDICSTCNSDSWCPQGKRIIAQVESTGKDYLPSNRKDNGKYLPTYITPNAITLTDDIQFILRFYGNANEIHKNYDFVHCTGYYESGTNNVTISSKVYECIINKTLRYQGSLYPFCSIVRLRKFIARGYTINAGEIAKMCIQLSQLNLKNIEVLEDQLTGVDMLYFSNIINHFKEWIAEDSNNELNAEFMCSVIDKVFNDEKLSEIRSKTKGRL